MILAQTKGSATPMTPGQSHHLSGDLSPRSSGSSSVMSDSPSPTSAKDLAHHQLLQVLHGGVEDISPLQRLQFAIERNSLFSTLFNGNGGLDETRTRAELMSPMNHRQPPTTVLVTPPKKSKTPDPSPQTGTTKYVQSPGGSPNSDPANIFQCPLCSIVCNGRHSFNEHLVTHTQHHACPKCDYLTASEEKLRDHLQEVHELTDPDSLEDPEVSVPKVNSQGKVKTFKCKQCEHVSVTKSEFWAHSKSHIRSEKMLNCPKCSFVTEYKHHLEYHLRNHTGSKPFVCTKCPYTCVNKSMLNSHLKSHSNVYQYRCADCSYATKYCHSLKLHLRKYNHNPSMVLNLDGTPNPLPIIDVYGTRRGPKMKRNPAPQPTSKGTVDYQPISSNGSSASSSMEDSQDTRDLPAPNSVSPPLLRKMQQETAVMTMTTPPLKRVTSDTSDSDNEMKRSSKSGIPMSPITPVQQSMDPAKSVFELTAKNPLQLYAAALNQYLFANPLLHMNAGSNPVDLAQQQGQILSHFLKNQGHPGPMLSGVVTNINNNNIMMGHHAQNLAPLDLRQLDKLEQSHNIELDSKRRKRKGKAIRHEKYQNGQVYADDGQGQALDFSTMGQRAAVEEAQATMMCKYCEISFPDRVLYSMHMSYHSGDRDPFHCKSCGKKTQDKVAFFQHLNTDSH